MSSSVDIVSRDGGDQSSNDRQNSADIDPSSIRLPQVRRVELVMLPTSSLNFLFSDYEECW